MMLTCTELEGGPVFLCLDICIYVHMYVFFYVTLCVYLLYVCSTILFSDLMGGRQMCIYMYEEGLKKASGLLLSVPSSIAQNCVADAGRLVWRNTQIPAGSQGIQL